MSLSTGHAGMAGRMGGRAAWGCDRPADERSKNLSSSVASTLPYVCNIFPIMRSISDLSYHFFRHLKPISNIESYNQVLRLTGVIMIPIGISQMRTYLKMSQFANKAKDAFSATLYKINALSNVVWVFFALSNGVVGTVLVSMKKLGHSISAARGMPIVGYIATGLYGLTSLCSLIGHIITASAGIKISFKCSNLSKTEDKIAHLRDQLRVTEDELQEIREKAKNKTFKIERDNLNVIINYKSSILTRLKREHLVNSQILVKDNETTQTVPNADLREIYISYKIKQIENQKQVKLASKLGLSKSTIDQILNGKADDALWKTICKEIRSHFIWKTIKSIINVMIVTSCAFVTLITPLAGDIMGFIINAWFIYSDFSKGSSAYKDYKPCKHDKKVMVLCTLLSVAAVGATLAISAMTGGTFPLVLAAISATAICSYNIYNWYHFTKASKASQIPEDKEPQLVESHHLLKFKDYITYSVDVAEKQQITDAKNKI